MDGAFYLDSRAPFLTGDITAVTLAATDKALYTASNFPVLGGQYFNYVGKGLRIRLFGRMTTGTAPGNGTWAIYYGTGADANGVLLASSGTLALSASATSLSWIMETDIICRTIGSVGTLFCTGWTELNVGLLASTLAPMLIPASVPVVSAACDLTAALIVSVQFKRSGSTTETMQVHQMSVIALN